MRKLLPAVCLAAAALAACNTAPAPERVLSGHYVFRGSSLATDPRGLTVSYEAAKVSDNANVAFSYISREDEPDTGTPRSIESQALRFQVRSHHGDANTFTWYIAPGVGYVLGVDDTGMGSYSGSFFYDLELGIRYPVTPAFGLSGIATYSILELEGKGLTPNVNLDGFTYGLGAYLDF